MKVKFFGTRGSVPVCGRNFLKYGGNTTCITIKDKRDNIIVVDCGTGIKNLGREVDGLSKINIIITHQHWDHIMGFPFFSPIYEKKTEIIITGCSYRSDDVRSLLSKVMQPPGFPIKFEEIESKFSFITMKKEGIKINNIMVFPIELSHPNGGLGYKFVEDNKTMVFLTDNELKYTHPGGRSFDDYVDFCRNADLLIADGDYTDDEYKIRKTWGHSSYTHAVELASKAGVKKLFLFHHNQERTDKDIDLIVKDCRRIFKKQKSDIECFAASEGEEIVV